MTLEELFSDPALKAKDRSAQIRELLMDGKVRVPALIAFAEHAKGPVKASCIEGLEYVTKTKPEFLPEVALDFCLRALKDKEPRVKWEAARTIANTIQLFPTRAEEAVKALLPNTSHQGTVVRWSAAHALARVLSMRTSLNSTLIKKSEDILKRETENSIRKIYEAALKKAAKGAAGKRV